MSDDGVVPLLTSAQRAAARLRAAKRNDVVGLLEDLLADARAGLLIGIVLAGERSDGGTMVAWTGTEDAPRRLGQLMMLTDDWLASMRDR